MSTTDYTAIKQAHHDGRLSDLEYFNNTWYDWEEYLAYYQKAAERKGTDIHLIDDHPLTRPERFRLKTSQLQPNVLFIDKYDPNKKIIEYLNYISVQGGDGTLLTAINKYYDLKKPFFGIAGGTVNFLMNEDSTVLPKHTLLKCHLIEVTVRCKDKSPTVVWAFNDIIIGEFNSWIDFKCTHSDHQIGTFKGAGLIIATAAGSTGANKNSGGPILPITSYHWAISSIQSNRQINTAIKPKEGLTVLPTSRGNVRVAVDGTNHEFTEVEEIKLTQGKSVHLIVNDLQKFQEKRQ